MEQTGRFHIEWRDSGDEPQCPADPDYPEGIDLDLSLGVAQSCICALPYPAKRIGGYVVTCKICGYRGGCTTAGRADDPRSIKVACHPMARA